MIPPKGCRGDGERLTHKVPLPRSRATWLAAFAAAALVALAVARIALFGWTPISPDDARYLNVGIAVLDGRGPVKPDGLTFLLRSPVYGLVLAAPPRWLGVDPIEGAHLVALGLALVGLIGAVRVGWLLGGAPGALGTAAVLLATPVVWRYLPTLRVDLAQTAGILLALLALFRPAALRWALAGLILGLTILVKETALLLTLLPLASISALPARRWGGLAMVFWLAVAGTIGWWWLLVWREAAVIFPLNAIAIIEARGEGALQLSPMAVALVGVSLAGWAMLVRRGHEDIRVRALALAGACLVPPAAYAFVHGLEARNYVGLATLSAVAAGAGLGPWLEAAWRRRGSARFMLVGAALLLVPVIALGQRQASRPFPAELPGRIAAQLEVASLGPGDRVVMPFRDREVVALQLGGDRPMVALPIANITGTDMPADFLWLGLRGNQLYGVRREAWVRVLGDPATRFLVLVEPHPLTPASLVPSLAAGDVDGVVLAGRETASGATATIFAVDGLAAAASAAGIRLHLDPAAALAWLDLGTPEALLAATPVVVGDQGRDTLLERLGSAACAIDPPASEPPDAIRLAPCGSG